MVVSDCVSVCMCVCGGGGGDVSDGGCIDWCSRSEGGGGVR